jgi:hypothetical protein
MSPFCIRSLDIFGSLIGFPKQQIDDYAEMLPINTSISKDEKRFCLIGELDFLDDPETAKPRLCK